MEQANGPVAKDMEYSAPVIIFMVPSTCGVSLRCRERWAKLLVIPSLDTAATQFSRYQSNSADLALMDCIKPIDGALLAN